MQPYSSRGKVDACVCYRVKMPVETRAARAKRFKRKRDTQGEKLLGESRWDSGASQGLLLDIGPDLLRKIITLLEENEFQNARLVHPAIYRESLQPCTWSSEVREKMWLKEMIRRMIVTHKPIRFEGAQMGEILAHLCYFNARTLSSSWNALKTEKDLVCLERQQLHNELREKVLKLNENICEIVTRWSVAWRSVGFNFPMDITVCVQEWVKDGVFPRIDQRKELAKVRDALRSARFLEADVCVIGPFEISLEKGNRELRNFLHFMPKDFSVGIS